MRTSTETIIDYLKQVVFKLDRIQSELQDIKQTVESNSANAFEYELASEKIKKLKNELRQKEYSEWFEKNRGNTSTTATEGVGS